MRPSTTVSSILLLISSLIERVTTIKGRLAASTISASFLHSCSRVRNSQLLQRNARLHLETSPLVGGPSWLPLHVKVLLETNDFIPANGAPSLSSQHQWDLIPVMPTNKSTLTKLTTLQYVPAQIRYRVYKISQYNDTNNNKSFPGLPYTIIYDSETLDGMSENIILLIGDCINFNSIEATSLLCLENVPCDNFNHDDQDLVQRAHKFCIQYMLRNNMKMHLLTNNCWAFALQLILHLVKSDKQSKRDHTMRISNSKSTRNNLYND
jgi:hypothetical protein